MNVIVAPTGDLILLIEGELPTPDEWDEVFSAGYNINVLSMPGGASTLDGLLPVAERITSIAINSYSCSDLRALERMKNLESLVVGGRVTAAPNLERLPLESFLGPVKKFESVLDLPSIRTLKLRSPSSLPRKITAPVEDLSIASARNLAGLDVVEDPSKLKKLEVRGPRSLDLGMISEMPNLERAMFQDCKELTSARVLAHAPSLNRLFLENCPKIDDLPELVTLRARVNVIGKNPFHQALRDLADRVLWVFPPGAAYLPKSQYGVQG